DEDPVVPHRRPGVDVAARVVAPADLPARRAERVDLAVRGADVHATVCDRGGRVELARVAEPRLRRRAPDQAAGAGGETVEVAVVRAEVEALARERGGALDRAARVEPPADLPRPL